MPVILLMISFLKPKTIPMVKIITLIPKAMPIIPIFTIGLEMLFPPLADCVIRLAINRSKFKLNKNT